MRRREATCPTTRARVLEACAWSIPSVAFVFCGRQSSEYARTRSRLGSHAREVSRAHSSARAVSCVLVRSIAVYCSLLRSCAHASASSQKYCHNTTLAPAPNPPKPAARILLSKILTVSLLSFRVTERAQNGQPHACLLLACDRSPANSGQRPPPACTKQTHATTAEARGHRRIALLGLDAIAPSAAL